MIDTQTLKKQHDLRHIVEQDLGAAPVRSSRASLWKCPFHNERKGFSLVVWPDGYRCFGKCQMSGDVFDWLQRYRHLSFGEAVVALQHAPFRPVVNPLHRPTPPVEPPPADWQASVWQVVEQAEEALWSSQGEQALTYLLEERSLETRTIRDARLGYIPGDYRDWRTIEGMNVPCGITIPWITDDTVWAVKVRRATDEPKYAQIKGSSSGGLYNGDALLGSPAVLFCEGEFDALLARQEGEGLVTAVSLGSAASTLNDRWTLDLLTVPLILVAYDTDGAGVKGASKLKLLSNRIHAIEVPEGKDITEFHKLGGDVFTWLAQELRRVRELTMPVAWAGQA
jgi:DNA primase